MASSKALVVTGSRSAGFVERDDPPVQPDEVRIEALFSGISHGTEMNMYRGDVANFLTGRDETTGLFSVSTETAGWSYPVPIGYATVGRIIETGAAVRGLAIGDLVFAAVPHASHATITAGAVQKLPSGVAPEVGVFSALLPTAYNAIQFGRIVLGETVVVFGLGPIGQLVAQLAKLSGASPVIVVDFLPSRRELAVSLGADVALDPGGVDVAMEIRRLTENRGADLAFECSGSSRALQEAMRTVGPQCSIVAVSWYPGEARGLYLDREFHFHSLTVQSAQFFSINPALTPRWTFERRNKTAVEFLKQLQLAPIISHTIDFAEAPAAYELIDRSPEQVNFVVFRHGNE